VNRTVIGIPLYNQSELLPEALESLLEQTRRDYALVLVDDSDDPAVEAVVRRYAALDPERVHYERNPRRLGMLANWRRAFALATARHPQAVYFAWGSDHDVWHPLWLERLAGVLDRDAGAVAAYPHTWRIGPGGRVLRLPWSFDTREEHRRGVRFKRASLSMVAGDMVYALFRIDALRRAGVFRAVVQPDRLLLAELALQGRFVQVPEVLWYRRRLGLKPTVARQRHTLFGERRPAYVLVPWQIQHVAAIAVNTGLRGDAEPGISRAGGLAAAVQYAQLVIGFRLRRRLRRATRRALGQVICAVSRKPRANL
jgi:glycosyltransferase involved in cell wall biosynthesis